MTNETSIMKIAVIGGSGLIGSKLVKMLVERGHQAVPASPNSGVNTLTGEGLAEVTSARARCCAARRRIRSKLIK
jgi:uncharacterized protein YbjT (DUF2867 family)